MALVFESLGLVRFAPHTTTERDALTNVPDGLVLHNTTTNQLEIFRDEEWQPLSRLLGLEDNAAADIDPVGTTGLIKITDDGVINADKSGNTLALSMAAAPTIGGVLLKDGGIHDADEDTSIWVEQSADEDIVRVKTAGVERVRVEANGDMQGNFIKMLDIAAAMVQATAPSTPANGQIWLDTAASGTGGLGVLNVTTITSNATLTTSQTVVLCDASSGAITVTLPAASGNDGRHYHIKKIDSSGNAVTIDGNGSETVDGETTQAIAVQYNSIQLVCDGSVWHIL